MLVARGVVHVEPTWVFSQLCRFGRLIKSAVEAIFTSQTGAGEPRNFERGVVVYDSPADNEGLVFLGRFPELLEYASKPYVNGEFRLSTKLSLPIPSNFLRDMGRIGDPDQFILDGEEISPAPRSLVQQRQLVQKLYDASQRNPGRVQIWTQIWNYRLKMILIEEVMRLFEDQYQLKPIIGRKLFDLVITALDTNEGVVSCVLRGKVEYALKDRPELELPEIINWKCSYSGCLSYDMKASVYRIEVSFQR